MLKALNPSGPPFYDDATREWVRDSRTDAVVLAVPSWRDVEPSPGQVDAGPFAAWEEIYRAVVADGKQPIIAIDCAYPPWSYRQRARSARKRPGLPANLAPDDLSPNGPWARHVARVMRRFPRGPVILLNEPNFALLDDPKRWANMARLIKSGAQVAKRCRRPHVLAPAMLDTAPRRDAEALLRALNWPFGKRRGWRPPAGVTVGWCQHPYSDINVHGGEPLGVKAVLALLHEYRWHAGARMWLTEGGYNFHTHQDAGADYVADPAYWSYSDLEGDEARQLARVTRHFRWCKRDGRVECWANYERADSLWAGWASGLFRHDGSAHPLAEHWLAL